MSSGEKATGPEPRSSEQLFEKLGEVKQSLHEIGQIVRQIAQEKFEKLRTAPPAGSTAGAEIPAATGGEAADMPESRGETPGGADESASCCAGVCDPQGLRDCIRAQPIKSVMIAAGIGALLFGALCRRR